MQPQNPFQPQQGQPPTLQHHGVEPTTPPAAQPQPPQAQTATTPQSADAKADTQPINNVTQYPVDYLNQIATPMPVKKASPILVFGTIAGILVALGVSLFIIIKSTSPPDVSTQLFALQTRLDTLGKVVNEQGPRLVQNQLSNINSTLGATIKSMQANLKSYMDSKKLKPTKESIAAKKVETTYYNNLSQSLNDAYLTGTLDRSYSSEMTYQVTILKSKLQKLKAAANSKSFTEFYDKNVPSLDVATDQISKFQSTK